MFETISEAVEQKIAYHSKLWEIELAIFDRRWERLVLRREAVKRLPVIGVGLDCSEMLEALAVANDAIKKFGRIAESF